MHRLYFGLTSLLGFYIMITCYLEHRDVSYAEMATVVIAALCSQIAKLEGVISEYRTRLGISKKSDT